MGIPAEDHLFGYFGYNMAVVSEKPSVKKKVEDVVLPDIVTKTDKPIATSNPPSPKIQKQKDKEKERFKSPPPKETESEADKQERPKEGRLQ